MSREQKVSDVVGPHVIIPTDDVVRVHDRVEGFHGKVEQWRCKYCGSTGTHPDDPGPNMSWRDDCEEFEVLESEAELLRD